MADQDKAATPPYAVLLKKAKEDVDLYVVRAGVFDATHEISRQAAMQMAEGLYPASFFAMLNRLNLLNEAIKVAITETSRLFQFAAPHPEPSPMADQDQAATPPYAVLLKKAKEEVDLCVVRAGVYDATLEISRQAALQLAEGLYPASFFAMLGRLKLLSEAVDAAIGKQPLDPE